jgi:ribose 1,5-bisphosphokinase PhnN
MRQHISQDDLRRLRVELAEARKVHRLDDDGEAEQRLERLLRLVEREKTR